MAKLSSSAFGRRRTKPKGEQMYKVEVKLNNGRVFRGYTFAHNSNEAVRLFKDRIANGEIEDTRGNILRVE